jgi:hypothetical protein
MREPYNTPGLYERLEPDDSVFGLSNLASWPAFFYLLFFLFVLVIYSANPLEPQAFGFYKLSVFFQVVSFFSIFFVPTLLIYFALDLTKSIGHTFVVLIYPLIALGVVSTLSIADLPLMSALCGFLLFIFYFLLGLSRSAAEKRRRRRSPRARGMARPSAATRTAASMAAQRRTNYEGAYVQRAPQSASSDRAHEFRRDARPQYGAPDGFIARLDRFLDRYDYVDGEAMPKSSRRSATYQRDRRRSRR